MILWRTHCQALFPKYFCTIMYYIIIVFADIIQCNLCHKWKRQQITLASFPDILIDSICIHFRHKSGTLNWTPVQLLITLLRIKICMQYYYTECNWRVLVNLRCVQSTLSYTGKIFVNLLHRRDILIFLETVNNWH